MQVSYSEGVAPRTGLESCVAVREGRGEALTEDSIGQPLSRERILLPDADAVLWAEGNTAVGVKRVQNRSGVVRDPGMCRRSLYGNREILVIDRKVRGGKARSRSRR